MKVTDVSVVVHERKLPAGMLFAADEVSGFGFTRTKASRAIRSSARQPQRHRPARRVKPVLIGRSPDIGARHELLGKRGMHTTVQGYVDADLRDAVKQRT
jgi:hypothetical protein